jgi:hypothetical protein
MCNVGYIMLIQVTKAFYIYTSDIFRYTNRNKWRRKNNTATVEPKKIILHITNLNTVVNWNMLEEP